MSANDPKLVVRALLLAEWEPSNHEAAEPEIRTGWRDENLDGPLVTVGPDDSTPTSDTGYDGIAGDGSGPTSTLRGTVDVNAWANRNSVDVNPKKAVNEWTKEVRRILREHGHVIASHPSVEADEYRYISWFGRNFLPDEPNDPEANTEYRYRAQVRTETHDDRQ